MTGIEEELRSSLRAMMHGTGPLPEVEPWRGYARRCRMLGRDVTAINGPLWTVVYAGKEMLGDAQALEKTMLLRAGGITLLMIGCRIVISQVRWNGDAIPVLPRYADILGFLVASLMSWAVLSSAVKSIPKPWFWMETAKRFSPDFFSWFEMLALDEAKSPPYFLPELAEADAQRSKLRALELRDGAPREEERRLAVVEAASILNRRDRVGLTRFSGTLPLLDLLMAGITAIGFCGVPFVEWLLQSGI